MAEITWTDEAKRWLEDIFEYIAADNLERQVARSKEYLIGCRFSPLFPKSGIATQLPRAMCGFCSTDITASHTSSRTTGT